VSKLLGMELRDEDWREDMQVKFILSPCNWISEKCKEKGVKDIIVSESEVVRAITEFQFVLDKRGVKAYI